MAYLLVTFLYEQKSDPPEAVTKKEAAQKRKPYKNEKNQNGEKKMLILAMESSAKPASVAICSNEDLLGQYYQNSGLTHSKTLLAMTESLMKNLNITPNQLELIAVSSGPGSFTGVRIGVSAAKGLAWGLDIPICGISTLEAMAYQTTEPNTLLCPVMDARRNQVYNALFEWQDEKLSRLCEDRPISLEDLETELRAHLNPNNTKTQIECLLIGDGASLSYNHLTASGIPCRIAPGLMRWQTAYGVALAAAHKEHIPAIELEPSYLRPSQAERELAARPAPPNPHTAYPAKTEPNPRAHQAP